MRWSLLTVKLCIVMVYVVLAGILLMAIVPLIQGGMDFDVEEGNAVSYAYEDGLLTTEVTVSIYNGGVLDIEDCQFRAESRLDNGTLLTSSHSIPVNLKAKEWTAVRLPLTININEVTSMMDQDVVFNGTTVSLDLAISTYVAMRLVHLELGTADAQEFEIPALISDVRADTDGINVVPYGDGYGIALPYGFRASDFIAGQEVSLNARLRNSTGTLGTTEQSITIVEDNSGQLIIPISDEAAQALMNGPDTLYFDLGLDFEGNEFTRTYQRQWDPSAPRGLSPMDWPPKVITSEGWTA